MIKNWPQTRSKGEIFRLFRYYAYYTEGLLLASRLWIRPFTADGRNTQVGSIQPTCELITEWVTCLMQLHVIAAGAVLCGVLSSSVGVSQESRPSLLEKDSPQAQRVSAIFSGSVPRNVDDLLAMQKKQRQVAAKVLQYTVSIRVGAAQGSGVIVSENGYVLTAAHVAGKAGRRAYIMKSDGTMLRGTTLGSNRGVDGGLVKIDTPGPHPFARMGSSKDLLTGQWVLVTGHPGGYQPDRKPVVRFGRVLSTSKDSLVTDCPLIGGDSGGPVFDIEGNVVAVNSRIGVQLTANIHVPVDTYRNSWDKLVKQEVWGFLPGHRPFIGVEGIRGSTTPKIAKVFDGSPAEKGGITAGDTILRFNDAEIDTFDALRKKVESSFPGDIARVVVRRGDKEVLLRVVIGKLGE